MHAHAGRLSDAPWGRTLAAFALGRRTGELVVRAGDGKEYRIAFIDGVVVAASSPLVADSVARIALTGHFVTPAQAPMLKRLSTAQQQDDIEAVADLAQLAHAQRAKLRQRVITQRTARTFAIENADWNFDPAITLTAVDGVDVDICPAIFLGVQLHLPEQRLAQDVRKLGARFTVKESANIDRFGFGGAEKKVVESLRAGASVAELDAKHRDIEPRTQQAVVYALVACNACTVEECEPVEPDVEARTHTSEWGGKPPRSKTPSRDVTARATTYSIPRAQTYEENGPAIPRTTSETSTTKTFARDRLAIPRTPTPRASSPRTITATGSPVVIPRTLTPRHLQALRETIEQGIAHLDNGADHYTLLGVNRETSVETIRVAYLGLASVLHKNKLPMTLDEESVRNAHRLFSQINIAFGVITDPVRRAEYDAHAHVRTHSQTKERFAEGSGVRDDSKRADAEYQRGIRALKREDLIEAVEALANAAMLVPDEVDYAAMLAWARFCASADKASIANDVRKVLERAIVRSDKPMVARFYLGRIERMLGRLPQALHHFRRVVEEEPGHADAAAEIRMLEQRVAAASRR